MSDHDHVNQDDRYATLAVHTRAVEDWLRRTLEANETLTVGLLPRQEDESAVNYLYRLRRFPEDDMAWGRFSVKDAKEIVQHLWDERIEMREYHQRRADRLQNRGLWARIRNKPVYEWED